MLTTATYQPETPQPESTSPAAGKNFILLGVIGVTLLLLGLLVWSYFTNNTQAELEATPTAISGAEQSSSGEELAPPLDPSAPFTLSLELTEDAQSPVTTAAASSVALMISSTDTEKVLDGVEVRIKYDPQTLGEVQVQPSSVFSSISRNVIDESEGIISLVFLRSANENITIENPSELAVLRFTPRAPGKTILVFDQNNTLVAGDEGSNLLRTTQDLSIEVQ